MYFVSFLFCIILLERCWFCLIGWMLYWQPSTHLFLPEVKSKQPCIGATTYSRMTLSIMTLDRMTTGLSVEVYLLLHWVLQHMNCYSQCHFNVILVNVIRANVILLNFIVANVFLLNVILLKVNLLNIFTLIVSLLIVIWAYVVTLLFQSRQEIMEKYRQTDQQQ